MIKVLIVEFEIYGLFECKMEMGNCKNKVVEVVFYVLMGVLKVYEILLNVFDCFFFGGRLERY